MGIPIIVPRTCPKYGGPHCGYSGCIPPDQIPYHCP